MTKEHTVFFFLEFGEWEFFILTIQVSLQMLHGIYFHKGPF